jgi:uncharacterized membrane protein
VRALSRIAAVAVAGAALYFAGIVNSIILAHPGRGGVGVVVLAIAAGIFVVTNLPFIVHDPQAWIAGIFTPALEPMFARGAGLIFLFTNGGLPLLPMLAYSALEAMAGIICVVVAWRTRRTSPELGAVLAIVPLFFAWRSLFSYFFLLPLFALAAVARMPLGELAFERSRRLGGLTIFAAPSRS